jgi:predicted nucleic acid-binding Zn ribbon protein
MDNLGSAISAIKAGEKQRGRKLLMAHLREHPNDARAWLWLASVIEDRERRAQAFERVLELEPDNEAARKQLSLLREPVPERSSREGRVIEASGVVTKECPHCYTTIDARAMVCPQCQRDQPEKEKQETREMRWGCLGLIILFIVLPALAVTLYEPESHEVVIRLDGTAERADVSYTLDADNLSSDPSSLRVRIPWSRRVDVPPGRRITVVAQATGPRSASIACTVIIDGAQRDYRAVTGTDIPVLCGAGVPDGRWTADAPRACGCP